MSQKLFSLFKPDILFLVLLALYPLFLGGNRPFPQYLFGSLLSINCFWVLTLYSSDVFQFRSLRLALYASFILLGLTFFNAAFISPNTAFALSGWALYLSYFVVIIQVMILASRKGFMTKLIKMVAFAGFIYSAYGLILVGMKSEMILFYPKMDYIGSLTSVFINRNHFALLAVISFLALIVIFVQKMKKEDIFAASKLSIISVRLLSFLMGEGLLTLVQMVVVLAAILLTQSRSGLALVMFGTMMMLVGSLFKNRQTIPYKKISLVFAGVIVLFSIVFSGFSQKTADRFHYVGASFSERVAVWTTTLEMIKDKPILGHGHKNFEYAFNQYRDQNVPLKKRWDKAHNDYLELIGEFGVIIPLIFFGFMGWVCRALWKSMLQNRRLYNDNLFMLSVTCVIALHSFVDFGMQMAANAAIFTALLFGAFARSIRSN